MPYFCHVHNGLYESVDGLEGCQHESCLAFRRKEVPADIRRMAHPDVPGGFNEAGRNSQYKFQKGFDPGLEAYGKARKEGLRPKHTSVAAVKAAQDEVRSQQRALKKLSKVADVSELNTLPGVK